MPDRENGKDIEEREKEASEKLEENLKKDEGTDKPKSPEDAKKKSEGDDGTPS